MKAFNVNILNPRKYGGEEAYAKLSEASTFAKVSLAIPNNVVFQFIRDLMVSMSASPIYKHRLKNLINAIDAEHRNYELNLIHRKQFPLFSVKHLVDEAKRSYKDNFTNEEYFQYWRATGLSKFKEIKPIIDCLCYKYYKILVKRGCKYPNEFAYILTLLAIINLQMQIFGIIVETSVRNYSVCKEDVMMVIKPLSLENVSRVVSKAYSYMKHNIGSYTMMPDELHDVQLTLDDYAKLCQDPTFIFESAKLAAEDYDEVFRTKGFQRKNVNNLNDYYNTAKTEMLNLKQKQH